MKTVSIGFALLLALVTWGVLSPDARLWGFHFLAYYPVIGKAAFVAAAVAAAAMVWWRPRLPQRIRDVLTFTPWQNDLLLALVCGVLFLAASSATAVWGDGQLWINGIRAHAADYVRNRATLTLLLLHRSYAWLNPLTGISPRHLYAVSSAAAGVFAVLAWLRLARHLGVSRSLALLAGFSWGGIALFFGYIETYSIAAAAVSWTLALAVISMQRRKPSLWVPVLGLISVGLSLSAVVFLPAVAAYALWMARPAGKPATLWKGAALLMLLLVAAYFALRWSSGNNVLLPLIPAAPLPVCVLSVRHLVDVVNNLALAGGPLWIVLLAAVVSARMSRIGWSTDRVVLSLAVCFPLVALVMHNPQLGMARDWDIGAALLTVLPLAALTVIPEHGTKFWRAGALVWIALVIAPWVGILSSERLSIERFRDLLRLDRAQSESGWDYLASYYADRGQTDLWAECNGEALALAPNPRYHANLAYYAALKQDWPEARRHAQAAQALVAADSVISQWEKSFLNTKPFLDVGKASLNRAFVGDALSAFEVASVLDPSAAEPPAASAVVCVTVQEFDQTLSFLDSAVQTGRAMPIFRSLSESRDPNDKTAGWLGLALAAQASGDSAESKHYAGMARAAADQDTALAHALHRRGL